MRELLDTILKSGIIHASKSSAGALILLVPKGHGGGPHLCLDYKGLNKVTILTYNPLPLMNEPHDRVRGVKIFTKLDPKAGDNLISIKKGNEWKTAFRLRHCHYEYTVIPLGLANAPTTFQNTKNEIFKHMIDNCVVMYLNDILTCHVAAESPMITRLKGPGSPDVTRYDSAHGTRDDSTPHEEVHQEPRHKPQPALLATPATAPTATPTTTTTSAPRAYSACTLALPHDTDDGLAPPSCDDGTAPSSCEDSGFIHLHRAAPDDGTTPPLCDADVIVPLRVTPQGLTPMREQA